MTKILIGYGTTEGQTARIAEYIAEVIRSHGIEAQARGPQAVARMPVWTVTTQ